MHITVLFSGLLRPIAGVEKEILEIPEGTTVNGLSGIIGKRYPDLPLEAEKTFFIINDQVSTGDQELLEGDRVRIFRLLAGG